MSLTAAGEMLLTSVEGILRDLQKATTEVTALKGVLSGSAVIGLPHADFGEGVTAVVVAKDKTLDEAKFGVLVAAVLSTALGAALSVAVSRLSRRENRHSSITPSAALTDLAVPVDPERDHIRGPVDAAVTLLEYGDYECIYCGRAEATIRELSAISR